ncbi:SDR family NAD(P)-dependent oxidoreductase [Arsenicitalea aurantiaca]|uniref:SDR family NAD(P)-dependent oxidoreductase n=1 Tax=Arsenicitalea aurantiaca TaxID=1783274 RepID=A0A433X428_9HYPH|nr:SDR family NAD(P)-dependent oxidoreductase [Arsenicitalea aurantiaca]RUT28819.1 SDR family NAD(P)-dependent oxidoreductase [Arsenicitalea aurantiaca]
MTETPFGSGPASAIVIGASGGIGSALFSALEAHGRFSRIVALGRNSSPALDLLDERSIASAAAEIALLDAKPRLVLDATGFLHGDGFEPEKSLGQIDGAHMARSFAVNAIGPALLMKHFLPLLPREGKAVFATLSARVGSISDNRLGGWYSYRAAKAALNQLVRTASVELRRRAPEAICVALHPGTVETRLSASFARRHLDVLTPADAATRLLKVIDAVGPEQSGAFLDNQGEPIPF